MISLRPDSQVAVPTGDAAESCEQTLRFNELAVLAQQGCEQSRNELASFLHGEFYKIALRLCGGQSFSRSLHATNLVNETFFRLIKSGVFREPKSKRYMFAAAGQTMRNVIADYFRHAQAKKRSPHGGRVYLEQIIEQLAVQPFEFESLHEAMEELEASAPRQAEIVNMRFFFGMTVREIADKLEISVSTVESEWRKARNWLFMQVH